MLGRAAVKARGVWARHYSDPSTARAPSSGPRLVFGWCRRRGAASRLGGARQQWSHNVEARRLILETESRRRAGEERGEVVGGGKRGVEEAGAVWTEVGGYLYLGRAADPSRRVDQVTFGHVFPR